VLDRQQTPALTQLLEAINPRVERMVIDASADPMQVLLALGEAIDRGQVVAILGDRARVNEATATVDFLGAPATFPIAPFRIASVLQVPVVLCFGMYRGGNRYDLHFELFADRLVLPRRGAEVDLRCVVQRYVARIEHYTRDDPYNWFNWYDIWNPAEPLADVSSARASEANGMEETGSTA
jgi:predicted LPLAT superfamily acyltransferase